MNKKYLLNDYKFLRFITLLILLGGIIIRIYSTFFIQTFNVDEISLGTNIKHSDYIRLLYPLEYRQSAPPLFLWIEKFFTQILPFPFWIKIKIFTLLCSIISVLLFYNYLNKKTKYPLVFLVPMLIFSFNPYIIYQSITVKQYICDVVIILLLINYYKTDFFRKFDYLFFLIATFLSNITLFIIPAYIIYNYINAKKNFFKKEHLFKNLKVLLAALPYMIYYLWFIHQDGATELKTYMQTYWSANFMPYNLGIFKFFAYLIYSLIMLFGVYDKIIGTILFLMILFSVFILFYKKSNSVFKNEITLLALVLMTHLFVSSFKLYPAASRLILYSSVLVNLLILVFFEYIFNNSKCLFFKKIFTYVFSVLIIVIFMTYYPFRANDYPALENYLHKNYSQKIYATPDAYRKITSFHKFTDFYFRKPDVSYSLINLKKQVESEHPYILVVRKKIKYSHKDKIIIDNTGKTIIKNHKHKKLKSFHNFIIYQID